MTGWTWTTRRLGPYFSPASPPTAGWASMASVRDETVEKVMCGRWQDAKVALLVEFPTCHWYTIPIHLLSLAWNVSCAIVRCSTIPVFPFAAWQSGDPYEAVCSGCQTGCDGCSFEEPPLAPTCTVVMAHAFSAGGTDTLEMLSIERRFWRSTPSSKMILACYNADACLGGVTGAPGYCREGYEGPCKSCLFGVSPPLRTYGSVGCCFHEQSCMLRCERVVQVCCTERSGNMTYLP